MPYEVLESRVEHAGPGRLRVVTTLATVADPGLGLTPDDGLGEGPTRETVPDRVVLALVAGGGTSMAAAEIKTKVGGNPATVNRQCWTLAANAPDVPHRLRGWVVSPEHGRYALSASARRRLEDPDVKAYWMARASRYQ